MKSSKLSTMHLPILYFFLLFTISDVFAHLHSRNRRASIPTPLNDPFYYPPDGWESKQPGDILKTRKVNLALFQVDQLKYKEAHQILYRTTASYESEPSYTVTTVIVPYNAQRNKLVNYQVYTDANGAQCAPSYSMRKGGNLGNDILLNYQQLLFSTFLDEGWILTIPDYQGPMRAFAAGRLEAHMSLDGVRATLNFNLTELSEDAKVVTYGYSGGAIASGWTAALQPSYAPEINAVGFALGGTPANVTNTVQSLDKGLFSGLCVTGFTGIYYAFSSIQDWARGKIHPKGVEAMEYARAHCLIDVQVKYPFNHVFSDEFFRNGENLLYEPFIQSIIGDIVLGLKETETPQAPVYMFHSQHDEIVPFPAAKKAAEDWAKHGADVFFQEFSDLTSEHAFSEIGNIPNTLFFIRDRFEGKPFPKGLTRKVSRNGLDDPNASLRGLGYLVNAIQDVLGRKIGPSDSLIKEQILQQAYS